MLASDKQSESSRTQVLIYTQRDGNNPFGEEGRPSGVLVLAGLANFPRLVDVDGDGDRDFCVAALQPDLIDAMRSASSRRIEFEYHVFRNEGGRFDRKPWMSESLSVPVEGGSFRARFFGDVTGDGTSEFLVRESEERVVVRLVRSKGERLTIESRPLFEMSVDEDARLALYGADEAGRGEFLVVESRSVQHVSFP